MRRCDGFLKMMLKWSELCPSACFEHLEPRHIHRNHIQLSRNAMNEISLKIRGCVWYDCVMVVALLLFCISDVWLYCSVTFVFISCLSKKYLHDGYLQWIAGITITAARTCAPLLSRIFNVLMCLVPCYHHCCMFLPSLFSHLVTIYEILGHKSMKEDRTVLKPRSPKLVSYASDFLYVTSFSFFGIWFLCGYTRKSWWLLRVS